MKIRGFEKIKYSQWEKDTLEKYFYYGKDFCHKIYDEIIMPKRMTACSAGYDIFSPIEFILPPRESIQIPTGLKIYMLNDEKVAFHPRSSLGFKYFIRLANTTGIGDSDYYNNINNEGHYWIKIRNEGEEMLSVSRGMAIAQCIFEKYLLADGDDFIGKTRIGGIGSTN